MTDASTDREPSLNDVASLFKDYSGDESGGQHAVRGFSFQVWQAVLETLRAHATGEDYAVVLEWQQDIAILDSSSKPKRVTFIQVKKNESSHHWTLNHLLSASSKDEQPASEVASTPSEDSSTGPKKVKKKALQRSTLAKLYFHRRRFSGLNLPAELVFASNSPFFVNAGDGAEEETVTEVKLDELPITARDKVVLALKKQLEIPADEALNLGNFTLRVTNCPTEEAHKFAIGELVELCEHNKIGVQITAPFVAVCLVASYVQQRAGKSAFAKDFEKLLTRAITRADVTLYFAAANNAHIRPQDLVEQIIARLNSEGADFEMVEELQVTLNSACTEVTNRTGLVWPSVQALAGLYIENDKYKAHGGQLKGRLPVWLADFRALKVQDAGFFSNGFLYCLMAMIIKDAQPLRHLSTAATGAQHEAEQ